MSEFSKHEFRSISSVAFRLGLEKAWLKREVEAGRLPAIKTGKRWFASEEDVATVLRKRGQSREILAMSQTADLQKMLMVGGDGDTDCAIRQELARRGLSSLNAQTEPDWTIYTCRQTNYVMTEFAGAGNAPSHGNF